MSGGSLNRVVRTAVAANRARAVVEDDFHHFRVRIEHDGARVVAIGAQALRYPYSLCPAAGGELQNLVGAALTTWASDVFRYTEPRLQCTHQFDLAALALAAAARGQGRTYRAQVFDAVDGLMKAWVSRDGAPVHEWSVEGYAISTPSRFGGLGLGQGFTSWVAANLDEGDAEAALVLRRSVFISRGRSRLPELDRMPHAPEFGGCWVQQPGRAQTARREIGSAQDFSTRPEMLTASDDAWLAFAD